MKVVADIELRYFEFWSGAKITRAILTDNEMDIIQSILEEVYPDGINETELNDIFWFEDDWIAETLGYKDFEELWNTRQ